MSQQCVLKYFLKLLGTTLAECKSGYGLNAETEIKMLKVINRGIKDQSLPIDLSVTFCGAHSIPKLVVN